MDIAAHLGVKPTPDERPPPGRASPGFSMAERENKNRRPAASQSRNAARSRIVAITSHPEQSYGRPSKTGAEEQGCTRLAKIVVPMLREAMDYEAGQVEQRDQRSQQ